MFRRTRAVVQVFLVHPGGPYFARRDDGSWSVPKGEIEAGEEPLAVAVREFAEETGRTAESCRTAAGWLALDEITQKGGKRVVAWAFEGDWPEGLAVRSNTVPLEWPPRSGRSIAVPEVDQGRFFGLDRARSKINPAQEPFLDRLLQALRDADGRSE